MTSQAVHSISIRRMQMSLRYQQPVWNFILIYRDCYKIYIQCTLIHYVLNVRGNSALSHPSQLVCAVRIIQAKPRYSLCRKLGSTAASSVGRGVQRCLRRHRVCYLTTLSISRPAFPGTLGFRERFWNSGVVPHLNYYPSPSKSFPICQLSAILPLDTV
jgi:hypothetical protein